MPSRITTTALLCLLLLQHSAAQQWMPKATVDPSSELLFADSANDESQPPKKNSRCEIFVPARYNPNQPSPLLLYLSPGARPQAARRWKFALNQGQIVYAAPLGIGNTVPVKDRIQSTMNVLHHMRKHYNIDLDRTYIVGLSGGGRVAMQMAFSYPGYFGGVIAICNGGDLPREPWLKDRVTERLRVALITGTSDYNRPEVVAKTLTALQGSGVETKSWVPKMGHTLPSAEVLVQSLMWLEEGLPHRQQLAAKFPATRIADHPTREAWLQRLLDEANERAKEPETLRSGVMLLKGIGERWPETKPGSDAQALYLKFEADEQSQTWKEEQQSLDQVRLIAMAKGMDAYAIADLPKIYESHRPQMLRSAISLWQVVAANSDNGEERDNAEARIEALRSHE